MNSRYIVRQVVCDFSDHAYGECGRAEWDDAVGYDVLRRRAKALGWLCDRSGDWCPHHRRAAPTGGEE